MRDALIVSLKRAADKGKKTKRLQSVAEALVSKAMEGDVSAIREIFDRVDGKVPQQTDVKVTQTPLDEVDAATLTALLAQLGRIADQRDSQADSGDESATRH